MLLPVSPAVAGAIAKGKRLREEDLEQKRLRELERQMREFELQKAKELFPLEKESMELDVALKRNQKIQSDIFTQNYENILQVQLDNMRANTELLRAQAQHYDKLTEKAGYEIRLINENLRDIQERRKIEQELQPVLEAIIQEVDEFLGVHDKYLNLNRQRTIKMMTSPLAKPEEFMEIDKQIQAAAKDMAEIRRIVGFLVSKALPKIKDPNVRNMILDLVKRIDITDEMQETMFTMIKTVRDNALVSVIKGLKGIDNLSVDDAFKIFSSMTPQDQEHVLKLTRYKMTETLFSKEMFPFMSLFIAYNADRDPTGTKVLDFFGTYYRVLDKEKDRELQRWIWERKVQMFQDLLKYRYDELAERREYHHILAGLQREKVKQGWETLRLRKWQTLVNFYSKVLALRYGLYKMDLKTVADILKGAWREFFEAATKGNVVLPTDVAQELGKFLISSALGVSPSSIAFDPQGELVITPRLLSEAYEKSLNDTDEFDTMLPGGEMFSRGGFLSGSPGATWQGPVPDTPGTPYRSPGAGQRIGMGMGIGPGTPTSNQAVTVEYDPVTDTLRVVNPPMVNQPPFRRSPIGGTGGPGGLGGPGFPGGYPITNMLFYGKERADMLKELIHIDPDTLRGRVFGNVTVGLAVRGDLSDSEWNTLARIFNQYVAPVIRKRVRDPGYIGSLRSRTQKGIELAPPQAGVPHWITVAQALAYQDFVNTLHEAIRRHVKDKTLQEKLIKVADIDFSYKELPQLPSTGEKKKGGKEPGGIYTERDTGKVPSSQQDLVREAQIIPTEPKIDEGKLTPFVNSLVGMIKKNVPYYSQLVPGLDVQIFFNPQSYSALNRPQEAKSAIAHAFKLAEQKSKQTKEMHIAGGHGGFTFTTEFNPKTFAYHVLNNLRKWGWRIEGDFIIAIRDSKGGYKYYKVVGWRARKENEPLFAPPPNVSRMQMKLWKEVAKKAKDVTFFVKPLTDKEEDQLFSEQMAKFTNALQWLSPIVPSQGGR